MNKLAKTLVGAVAGLALALGLAACTSSESVLALEINDETGALMISADNADGEVTSAIELGEGDILQLSPFFDKGSATVKLNDESGNTVFEETVDGKVLSTYEVEPGTYEVVVTANDGTTGTMTIYAANADELAEMEASLDEALSEAEQSADQAN